MLPWEKDNGECLTIVNFFIFSLTFSLFASCAFSLKNIIFGFIYIFTNYVPYLCIFFNMNKLIKVRYFILDNLVRPEREKGQKYS